jgi:hypothetical protein
MEEPSVSYEELTVVLDDLERLARERRIAELHDLLGRVMHMQTGERSEGA